MKVLIIPEDFRKDQYIVLPLVRRMFAEVGKPNANVQVCRDPVLGGISQATNWNRINEVLSMYPMVDLFLLLVDRDGVATRREALNQIESLSALRGDVLFAENAWQEIEVWALAGQNLPKDWNWQAVRAEPHPKERYFEPFAQERRLTYEPGGGRKTLGRESATNYKRVRSRCAEDVAALESKLKKWLKNA